MRIRIRYTKPETQYTFADLAFPHIVEPLASKWDKAARQNRYQHCGPLHLAPRSGATMMGFYLDSTMPGLRWAWCDEVNRSQRHAGIKHKGWYTDEYGEGDTIRGLVMRLPSACGFLAGWSMGEGMASAVEYYVYAEEVSAACAADSMAQYTAEREREEATTRAIEGA